MKSAGVLNEYFHWVCKPLWLLPEMSKETDLLIGLVWGFLIVPIILIVSILWIIGVL